MDEDDSDIELINQEEGAEHSAERPAEQQEEEPELFDQSYIEGSKRKPPLILVGVIVLLVLSVFLKKCMVSYSQDQPVQVEKPVKN